MITFLINLLIRSTTKNVYKQFKSYLLFSAHDGGKCLLYKYCSVKSTRRIFANITVVAIMIHCFSEIIEQNSATTHLTLRILLHTIQLFIIDILLTTFFCKLSKHYKITYLIKQNSLARKSVTSSTSYLLIIALYTFRQIVMNNKAHITLVNTHTKSNCCAHHIYFVVNKCFLHIVSFISRKSCMISLGTNTFFLKFLGHHFCCFPAHAIYYTTLVMMTSN